MTEAGHVVGVVDAAAVPDDVQGGETAPPPVERVVDAVEDAGAEARVAAPDALASADLAGVVAPGEAALRAVAVAAPDAPILPVDVEPGVRAVGVEDVAGAVTELCAGAVATERHPILRASVDGEPVGDCFRDATLVTAEPARISEFGVDAATAGHVDVVRADGVVVATPAGSHGYAAAGDGPLLAPGTGLAVVPVAPFRTNRRHWVLPVAGLTAAVHRDEAAVAVEVDGSRQRTVGEDATVAFEPVDEVAVAVVEASAPTFG